jgi:hypothetical protein
MAQDKFMFPRFTCGRQFQMGPHRYDGRLFRVIKFPSAGHATTPIGMVGGPDREQRLVAHLKEN